MLNGEIEKGEEVEGWLSGMKKYFQIYNYSDELKDKMAIYNLTGKEDIWLRYIKKVKGIKERYVTYKTFKKHFKIKYLSKQYYEALQQNTVINVSFSFLFSVHYHF